MNKVQIKNDLFNISGRVKKIFRNYFIVYDKYFKRYELHCSGQKYGTLCLILGKILDARVLKKVLETQSKNAKKIFKDFETQNEKLKQKEREYVINRNKRNLKDFITYADKKGDDCDFHFANSTRWI